MDGYVLLEHSEKTASFNCFPFPVHPWIVQDAGYEVCHYVRNSRSSAKAYIQRAFALRPGRFVVASVALTGCGHLFTPFHKLSGALVGVAVARGEIGAFCVLSAGTPGLQK